MSVTDTLSYVYDHVYAYFGEFLFIRLMTMHIMDIYQ